MIEFILLGSAMISTARQPLSSISAGLCACQTGDGAATVER